MTDCYEGIVTRDKLNGPSRLPGETLAIEALVNPIQFGINDGTLGQRLEIIVDRSSVRYAVINPDGKRNLCNYCHPLIKMGRMDELMEFDQEIHSILLNKGTTKSNISEEDWRSKIMPLRWASGGVLPLVTISNNTKRSHWIPFFFRDINPSGWNIPLGATQRSFSDNGNCEGGLESELNNPWITSSREFLEETLVLDRDPGTDSKAYYYPIRLAGNTNGVLQTPTFARMTTRLRREHDGLLLSPSPSVIVPTTVLSTNTRLVVRDPNGSMHHLDNVLVVFSLSDLGIEVVRVVEMEIKNVNPYFLDGEVLEYALPELTRMPVALISYNYLKRVFSGDISGLFGGIGAEPSILVNQQMTDDEVIFFDWDNEQRKRILRREKEGVGTEMDRYRRWADSFLDVSGKLKSEACRRFAPATAKILNLFFKQNITVI